MADDLVKRATEALDGVTLGPWRVFTPDDYEGPEYHPGLGVESEKGNAVVWYATGPEEGLERDQDARFIAASRELVPAMVDRIRELEAQLATVLQRETETAARYDAKVEALEAEVARLTQDRMYIVGANDGWDAAVEQGEASTAVEKAMVRFWLRLAESHCNRAEAAEAKLAKARETLNALDSALERDGWHYASIAREGIRATLKEIGNG